jgi:hypothetical protein
MKTVRNVHRVLVVVVVVGGGGDRRKETIMKTRHRWEDNFKMDLGRGGMDWIHSALKRDHWKALVKTVMNLRDP